MSELLKNVDARTRLAGTNKLEILLFTLGVDPQTGCKETYAINVFKVLKVIRAPARITRAPDMPPAVEGMFSLRGQLVPVVDLAKYAGVEPERPPRILIITEFNGHRQGFLVEDVDTLVRLEWSAVRVPPEMLSAQKGGLVTAVTELADRRLVMLMDVEKVLADTTGYDDSHVYAQLQPINVANRTVFYVDDSSVARKQIQRTLDSLGILSLSASNGVQAWEALQRIAAQAQAQARPVSDYIQLILTDIEMPQMDGYVLTRRIKQDARFNGIPVIMHSSLSSDANRQLGHSVGVDDYVPKFSPQALANLLQQFLA